MASFMLPPRRPDGELVARHDASFHARCLGTLRDTDADLHLMRRHVARYYTASDDAVELKRRRARRGARRSFTPFRYRFIYFTPLFIELGDFLRDFRAI